MPCGQWVEIFSEGKKLFKLLKMLKLVKILSLVASTGTPTYNAVLLYRRILCNAFFLNQKFFFSNYSSTMQKYSHRNQGDKK